MLSPELCKQLKDAGFPQKRFSHSGQCDPEDHEFSLVENGMVCCISCGDAESYSPTISELIEACGKRITLEVREINCLAFLTNNWQIKGCGDIPEEAVAKLWLELNKKV